jgi:DNA polymerase-1
MKLLPAVDTNLEWRARYAHRDRIIVNDVQTCSKALTVLDRALAAGTPGFGFDTETDTVERTHVVPVTAQVSFANTDIFFSPEYVQELRPWVAQKPTMYGFESKFELWAMENAGMPWDGEVHDAQITDYLVDENVKDYDLKTRCAAIFKEPRRPDWKLLFKNRKASEIWESGDRDLFIDYACADSADHLRLHENRAEELRKWPLRKSGVGNMYDDFYLTSETQLTRVLYTMERTGARLDTELLQELHVIAQREMESLQRQFYREIDFEKLPKQQKTKIKGEFSGFSEKLMNSPKQLMELFYTVLDYPEQYHLVREKGSRKKVKKLTTNEGALDALAAEGYPAAVLLNENRGIEKLDGTYLVGLVERAIDDYVHTNFMQAFTTTGRLSSRDPNLQNIPRKANDKFGIRGAFIAPPGYVIVGGDYGQVETRLMAILSGDQDMIRACMESDIYVAMAQIMYHKPKEFFAKNAEGHRTADADRIRQHVKAIVLGIGFGKQAKSIARELGVREREAEGLLKMYFLRFPVFAKWMRRQIQKAKSEGYVRTIEGRYRRLPDLRLPDTKELWWRRSTAERQALNSPVQGSAWAIMKRAMLNLSSSGLLEKHDAKMFLTVHDELLNYVPREEARAFELPFKELMEHPFAKDFSVPLAVDTYRSLDWGSGH